MDTQRLHAATILIVDDQQTNLDLLAVMLDAAGYTRLHTVVDSRDAVATYERVQPDLVLLDLHMPYLDGVAVMQALETRLADDYVPIVILTGDSTSEAKERALSLGAKDFLLKPFNRTEVLLRLRNLLETRFLYTQLQRHNAALEQAVAERTHELEQTQTEILERLATAAEYRDDATGRHAQRVGDLSALVAEALDLPADDVDLIRHAALLHDVGKIGVPDHILLKRGVYTADERAQMALHTAIGARIVAGSRSPLLQLAEAVALTHHDRWDTGGPGRPGGDAIPLAGRIVAVADVFDALTHERPYKSAWPPDDAAAEIARQRGAQFDPAVVDAFLSVLERCAPEALLSDAA